MEYDEDMDTPETQHAAEVAAQRIHEKVSTDTASLIAAQVRDQIDGDQA